MDGRTVAARTRKLRATGRRPLGMNARSAEVLKCTLAHTKGSSEATCRTGQRWVGKPLSGGCCTQREQARQARPLFCVTTFGAS
eukprot:732747-Alexandrium_andersonii.AAC.1